MHYPITEEQINKALELFCDDKEVTELARSFLQNIRNILNAAYDAGTNDINPKRQYIADEVLESFAKEKGLDEDDMKLVSMVYDLANEVYKTSWKDRIQNLGELIGYQKSEICFSMDIHAFMEFEKEKKEKYSSLAYSHEYLKVLDAYTYGFIMGKRAERARRKAGAKA